MLLSDLAAHSSVPCPTGSVSLFLAGHHSCPWLPGPSFSLGAHILALGQHLVKLSCLWIAVIFLFPSFCNPSWQVLLIPPPVLLLTDVVSLWGPFAHRSFCCFQSFLALGIEKKRPLVLVMPFMSGSLMTKKRTRFSLKEIYNHFLNLFADTTSLAMNSKRSKFFSCLFGTEKHGQPEQWPFLSFH